MADTPMPEYVVLTLMMDGSWERHPGTYRARDGEAAIKHAANVELAEGRTEGTFVAIPARSFNPVKVTAHVETSFVLGEVTA